MIEVNLSETVDSSCWARHGCNVGGIYTFYGHLYGWWAHLEDLRLNSISQGRWRCPSKPSSGQADTSIDMSTSKRKLYRRVIVDYGEYSSVLGEPGIMNDRE
jgi:hypothetical protein